MENFRLLSWGQDRMQRGLREERGVEDASRRVARVKLELANDDGIRDGDFDCKPSHIFVDL